jgi:hypothetical protein
MTTHTSERVWPTLVIGSMLILTAAPVRAQQVATSFEELLDLVQPGETIYVTDVGGGIIKGTLAGVAASSLQLRVGPDAGARSVDVSQRHVNNVVVERFDSLWNGMLTGFVAAAAPIALIGLGSSAPAGEIGSIAAGYGGLGLITGLLIDIFNREKATIYVQPAGQRSSGFGISPTSPHRGLTIQLSLQY